MAAAPASAEQRLPAPSPSLFPPQQMSGHFGFSLVPADEPEEPPPPAPIGVPPGLEAAADEIRRKAITVASTLNTRTTAPKLEAAQAELLAISSRALNLYAAVADELERVRG